MTIDFLGGALAWLVVFVSVPLCWFVTVSLLLKSRERPGNRVLRLQFLAMLALALLATVFAIVFVNNDFPSPPLDVAMTRVMTRGAVFVLTTGVALYWLWLYRGDR